VLTKAADLEGGRAEFELPLTQDLQGTLQVHAYQILPDENIIRDTRLLYVEPADDLVVEVRPNQDTYRPGDPAELSFSVRDQQGRPTLAALGVTIVDESVFALQEMQPGLERIYFALEKELMKPRYEIHGFTTEGVVSGRLPFAPKEPEAEEATRQRAAAVLFAATEQRNPHTLTVNTYDQRLEQAMEAWTKQMARDAEKIDRALRKYYEKHRTYLSDDADVSVLVDEGFLKKSDLRDRWGNAYKVHWHQVQCGLDSAGPDGRWDTKDDMRGIGQWAKDRRMWLRAEGDAVDENVQRYVGLGDAVEVDDGAAGKGPGEAVLLERGPALLARPGESDEGSGPPGLLGELGDGAVDRIAEDGPSALEAVDRAYPGEKDAEVIEDLRDRGHGRARVLGRALLLDGGRRRAIRCSGAGLRRRGCRRRARICPIR